jgi:hypothetical protein
LSGVTFDAFGSGEIGSIGFLADRCNDFVIRRHGITDDQPTGSARGTQHQNFHLNLRRNSN